MQSIKYYIYITYNNIYVIYLCNILCEIFIVCDQINDSHQQLGTWEEVGFTPRPRTLSSPLTQHYVSYNIKGLQPAAVFQVHVQARNRYGWGDLSDVYQFYTRGIDDHFFGNIVVY